MRLNVLSREFRIVVSLSYKLKKRGDSTLNTHPSTAAATNAARKDRIALHAEAGLRSYAD